MLIFIIDIEIQFRTKNIKRYKSLRKILQNVIVKEKLSKLPLLKKESLKQSSMCPL